LDNATKFTERGGITLSLASTGPSGGRDFLKVTVEDTGIGIPEEALEHIFEPFFQSQTAVRKNKPGSGLGLTISYSLATLMGGALSVESREGVGSSFCLRLPLERIIEKTKGGYPHEKLDDLWNGPALNVLLAEDNNLNVNFIKNILEKMGHVVTVANDGLAALEIVYNHAFDLLLMDIEMPLVNGAEALKVLRAREQFTGKHLKVIALTAFALLGDREKYFKLGFDGYLSKPFMAKDLSDEMLRVVQS
jgi:CheY-like chemotaxis protein